MSGADHRELAEIALDEAQRARCLMHVALVFRVLRGMDATSC